MDNAIVHIKDSISTQLLKVVFSFYIFLTIAVTLTHMSVEFISAKDKVTHELEVIGDTFNAGLSRALWDMNLAQLKPTFLGMVQFPTVVGVKLENEFKEVVGASGMVVNQDGNVERITSIGERVLVKGITGLFNYSFPLIHTRRGKEINVGQATIYSSTGVVFEKVQLGFVFIIVNSIIKTIALWALFLIISRNLLSRPLAALTAATKQISMDRLENLKISIVTKGRNELKILEESFNAMIQKLKGAKEELYNNARQLEDRNKELSLMSADLTLSNLRLTTILDTTKTLASTHDKMQAMEHITKTILREIPIAQSPNVQVVYHDIQSDGKEGFISYLMTPRFSKEGDLVEKSDGTLEIEPSFSKEFPVSTQTRIEAKKETGSLITDDTLEVMAFRDEKLLGLIKIKNIDPTAFTIEHQAFVDTLSQFLSLTLEEIEMTQGLEKKVEERTILLRDILENINQGVVAFDSDLKLLTWNKHFREITQLPASLMTVGQPLQNLTRRLAESGSYGAGDQQIVVENRLKEIREGTPTYLELRDKYYYITPQKNDDGRLVITFTDLTERKRIETELKEREALLDNIFETTPIPLFITRQADGQHLKVNQAAVKFHQLSREELLRKNTSSAYTNPKDRSKMLKLLEKQGEVINVEFQAKRMGTNEARWVFLTAKSINYLGETALLSAAHDITERKKSEEALHTSMQQLEEQHQQLKQTQAQLIQSEKMASLGTLVAGVAHELNNPAAASQRGAEQLQDALLQLERIQFKLGELCMAGEQLSTLERLAQRTHEQAKKPTDLDPLTRSDRESEIEIWLEEQGIEDAWTLAPMLINIEYDRGVLSKLTENFTTEQFPIVLASLCHIYTTHSLLEELGQGSGRISEIVKALKSYAYLGQAPIQFIDIHEGLNDTLVMLRNKLKKGVNVRRDYAEDLPPIQAFGSELNQVWTNIIDNAVSAMGGQGEIVLRTYREDPWVIVEIKDTGPGIPEEIQSKIFDPFFTTKAPGEGTGLGLNISHNIIVQKHQGEISVSSKPGETCFEVKLLLNIKESEA